MNVAYRMGILHLVFTSKEFDDNCMRDMGGNHFIINSDNGRTLWFCGDDNLSTQMPYPTAWEWR